MRFCHAIFLVYILFVIICPSIVFIFFPQVLLLPSYRTILVYYVQFRMPLLVLVVSMLELSEDSSIPDDEHFIDIEDEPCKKLFWWTHAESFLIFPIA